MFMVGKYSFLFKKRLEIQSLKSFWKKKLRPHIKREDLTCEIEGAREKV